MPSYLTAQGGVLLPSAELNLGGTSTSEKQFLIATATAGIAVTQPLTCRIPGSNMFKQARPMIIRAAGRYSAASGTFTAAISFGNSTTITAGNKMATTGAITSNTSGTWFLEIDATWDSTSQSINGIFWGYVRGGTAVAQTTLSNVISSVDLSVEPNLAVAALTTNCVHCTGQFGAGAAANVAFVDVLEVIAD